MASRKKIRVIPGVKDLGDGRCRIRYDLPPDPRTGKRRQKSETIRATPREAELRRAELILAARRGGVAIPKRMTVEQLMIDWYKHYCATKTKSKNKPSRKRLNDVKSRIACHIVPALGHLELDKLTPYHIQMFIDGIDRAARTVRGVYETLDMALRWAVKMQLIPSNPPADIELPPVERPDIKPLTEAQAAKFLKYAKKLLPYRLHVLFATALFTGLRRGELLALRWADVDFKRRVLYVRYTLQLSKDGYKLVPPKTNNSIRQLPFSLQLLKLLEKHKAEQNKKRILAGPAWQDNDLVFCNEIGQPLDPDNLVKRYFKPLLKKAGLPDVRFHDLRHTYATLLLERGVHIKVVTARLGHAREAFTLATYTSATPALEAGTANVLDDLLGTHCEMM